MPRPNLQQLRTALEFQHVYHWDVNIVTPPTGIDIDPDRWNMQAFTVEIPRRTVEVAQVELRGHRIHEFGRVVPVGELTFVYVETVDAYVRNIVRTWTEALRDRNMPTVELLADFSLRSLDTTLGGTVGNQDAAPVGPAFHQEPPNYGYVIQMAFLRDTTPPTLDGQSPDPAQWSLVLQYNDFYEGPSTAA